MNADTAEIREGLSDHETRLLYLENLHTQPDCRVEEEPKLPEVKAEIGYHSLYKRLNEVNGLLLKFQRELNEHIDAARKKRTEYIIK